MSKITKIGSAGIALIKASERFMPRPYLCPAGRWTIGYGTTWYFDKKRAVTEHDPAITEAEALRLLMGHVNSIFAPLADKLCRDDLNQNEFDAVLDFLYNCGATWKDKLGKLHYYDLFEHINSRMPESQLREYWQGLCVTVHKVRLNGLMYRRKKEADLFFS